MRALLGDFIDQYKSNVPTLIHGSQLAMAVWFGRSSEATEPNLRYHLLLMVFTEPPMNKIELDPAASPLLWKVGHEGPPFIQVHWTSVDYLAQEIKSNFESIRKTYFEKKFEVLYFDRAHLDDSIIRAFNVITEPPGLIKGWYVSADQYDKTQTVRSLLASRGKARPGIGIVKTWESPDAETCRALVHVEIGQKWLPSSPEGIAPYSYYSDWLGGHPGYFLLQGGAVYRILKFEVIKAPEYSARVLEKLRDDRYPEVYLRAVYPPEQPTA